MNFRAQLAVSTPGNDLILSPPISAPEGPELVGLHYKAAVLSRTKLRIRMSTEVFSNSALLSQTLRGGNQANTF